MLSNRPVNNDFVAGPYFTPVTYVAVPPTEDAYSGGVDEHLITFAPVNYLRIAGYDHYSCLSGFIGHGDDNLFEICIKKTLLDNESGTKVKWPGPGYSQVVDRAAYSQFANIAAREENWIDDKGIGRECDFPAFNIQNTRIGLLFQVNIVKVTDKQVTDKVMAQFPSASVTE